MRRITHLQLAALIFLTSCATKTHHLPITIVTAVWGRPGDNHIKDITEQVAKLCNGLTICTVPNNSVWAPEPESTHGRAKSLDIVYRCGNNSSEFASSGYRLHYTVAACQ